MDDLQYRAAIFGYKLKAKLRKRFRNTQAEREKSKKSQNLTKLDKFLYWTVERWWFKGLPQKPEINLVFSGYRGRRHIIECYPGKAKKPDYVRAKAIEDAWKDYRERPDKRALISDFIDWVIRDAAESGHIHDLSDYSKSIDFTTASAAQIFTARCMTGLFRGYLNSFVLGKDVPLANIDRSNPWESTWYYDVHGATIPNLKIWEDNKRMTERGMGTPVIIDNPEDAPHSVRIRPRRRLKSKPLPKIGGTHANAFAFGFESETRKRIEIPIAHMRHTFGIGTPGAGKTAMLEGLMLTALGARELVENVYYIDVAKAAAGLDHVEKAGAIFARELQEAYDVINTIWDVMKLRTKVMKRSKTAERKIFLFIDEAAQIFDADDADRDQQSQAVKRLIRLSQLSRAAAVHLITFTQKPTIDFIPSSYLDNHEGRLCMRVLRMRTASDFMNVDFEWDPTRFADGEFAMLWPGWLRERYGRGFISDKMR